MGMAAAGLTAAGGLQNETAAAERAENRVLNIYDNMVFEAGDAISQWGFSAYITYNGKTILFDAGSYPGIVEHNAKVLGADIRSVDIALLSHNHLDHIGGFDYVLDVNRDFAFYLPNELNLGGTHPSLDELDSRYPRGYRYHHKNSHFIKKNTEIAPGMHIIATSSPLLGSFSKYPPNEKNPQLTELPEISLALERNDGSVCLISGCSHSKIEEIVKETRRHLGKEISLVIGGFHHNPFSSEYVTAIARMMKDELGVKKCACSHCTGEKAVAIFRDIYGDNYIRGGLGSSLTI